MLCWFKSDQIDSTNFQSFFASSPPRTNLGGKRGLIPFCAFENISPQGQVSLDCRQVCPHPDKVLLWSSFLFVHS